MAGGVITTGNSPKALRPGVKAWFGRMYQDYTPRYVELFDKVNSTMSYEEYVGITGFGPANVKAQGQNLTYDTEQQTFVSRLTNVTVALGYEVTMEEIEDNLYMQVASTRAAALARSMHQTKETFGALVYLNGFNNTYAGGDGVSLWNTAHPTQSGNQSNMLAVGADLSEAAIEDLIIQIRNATDDRGLRIQLMPRSLIIAPANEFIANRILKSHYQSGTGNNDINVLKANASLPDGIKINPFLSASPMTWSIRTNIPSGTGLIYQERRAIKFDTDNSFDNKNEKFSADERYVFGWADWRSTFSSQAP